MMTCPIAHLATLMVFVAIGFFRLSSMESRFRSLPLDRSGDTQEPFTMLTPGADRENSSLDSYGRIRFLAHPTPVENLGCVAMSNIRANSRSWTDRSSVFVGFTARRSLFFAEANPYKVGGGKVFFNAKQRHRSFNQSCRDGRPRRLCRTLPGD